MKLNEQFEHIRSYIIGMDPLSPINKTYNLVQQVEKQKQITTLSVDQPTTFYSHTNNAVNNRKEFKKPRDPTQRKFCEFCKSEGHTYETCFERVGYPDWWKGPRKNTQQQIGKKFSRHANCVQEFTAINPLDNETNHTGLDQQFLATVCQEVCKIINSKMTSHNTADNSESTLQDNTSVNFAGLYH